MAVGAPYVTTTGTVTMPRWSATNSVSPEVRERHKYTQWSLSDLELCVKDASSIQDTCCSPIANCIM